MATFVASNSNQIPPYPELTPGHENKHKNYWPDLSPQAKTALDRLEAWRTEKNIEMSDLAIECVDHKLVLLRYLRANNLDVSKAITHMEKNIQWRNEMNIKELVKMTPEQILGFEMKDLTKVFPHWHFGYDKTGRPVVYKQYGKFDASHVKTLAGGNYDKIVKYHAWEQEACLRLCLKQTAATGKLVETVTGVVDVKDMSLFQITRDFLALTKLLADVDQGQYPETLGRIYIINTPSAFPMVWRMVKPWLDPIVTSKIFIFGGAKDYEPALHDFIGKENLPTNYGGNQPALNINVHPYTETLREYTNRTATPDDSPLKRADSNGDIATVGTANSDEPNLEADVLTFANGL